MNDDAIALGGGRVRFGDGFYGDAVGCITQDLEGMVALRLLHCLQDGGWSRVSRERFIQGTGHGMDIGTCSLTCREEEGGATKEDDGKD